MRSSWSKVRLAALITVLCWAGWASSEPVVEVALGERDGALERLEAALEREGLTVAQRFDIAAGLAGRNQPFEPYWLLTLAPEATLEELLMAMPELATIFPLTVYVYAQGETVRAGVLHQDALSGLRLEREHKALLLDHHARILRALGVEQRHDAKSTSTASPLIITRHVAHMDAATAALFLEAALSGQNLNVIKTQSFGQVHQLSACSLGYAAAVLAPLPAFGALAPCRVVVYPDGDSARVALLAPAALESLFDLSPEITTVVQEIYALLEAALVDLGAE
jgi:uncharacterized protein (DUF302 family)